MEQKYAIGLDLGGTTLKYALISQDGTILNYGKIPSMAEVSAEAIIGQVMKAISFMTEAAGQDRAVKIAGIGIGTPGIVDNGRIIGGTENMTGWTGIDIVSIIESRTGLRAFAANDANMMGFGETLFGAGKGASDVVFLTVGTGIGGAVVTGGKLFTGYGGRGTELGHVPVLADGETCACGSTGCLEHYASASALVRMFTEEMRAQGLPCDGADGKYIMDLCHAGDKVALKCLDRHCDLLGHGIAGFINIFSPQMVIIGGGLADAGEFYLSRVREKAFRYAMPECAAGTEIKGAALGNKAGCFGAAAMVFQGTE